jgi:hypothetical protein
MFTNATLLESGWIKKRPDAIVSTGRWSSEHDPGRGLPSGGEAANPCSGVGAHEFGSPVCGSEKLYPHTTPSPAQ